MEKCKFALKEHAIGYWSRMQSASRNETMEERRRLSGIMNGDVFFDMKLWPVWMKRIFWQKPLTDTNTFILTLFLFGNGCSPYIICEWVITSVVGYESYSRQRKRMEQTLRILERTLSRSREWYYFDIFHGRYVFLNCDFRTKS